MSKTKILVVSERCWPDGSGGELATHSILRLLSEEGFEVKVITGTERPEMIEGVEYVFEPLLTKREKVFLWPNVIRLTRKQYFRRLVEWADVVYIPRFSFPVIPLAKRLGKKVVVHLHGYIPISYTATILAPFEEHRSKIVLDDISMECGEGIKKCVGVSTLWWLPRLARKWIAEADTAICVSKGQSHIISELAPELKDKIKVIYNPPPETPKIEKNLSERPLFLYVGGGSYVKGFYILLKALDVMAKNYKPKAKLVFANKYTPNQIEILKRLREKHGLDIEVVGRLNYNELLILHSRAWALLFPSIWEEPLPYAVVEAMVSGTLPIASKVGGVPEIVEGTVAEKFLIPPMDYLSLIKNIIVIESSDMKTMSELTQNLREKSLSKFENMERNTRKNLIETFLKI